MVKILQNLWKKTILGTSTSETQVDYYFMTYLAKLM